MTTPTDPPEDLGDQRGDAPTPRAVGGRTTGPPAPAPTGPDPSPETAGATDPGALAVRVPASTSNVGPGFDFLGLALGLWLDVRRLGPSAGGEHELHDRSGTQRDWSLEEDRLLIAFDHALRAAGARPLPSVFEVRSEIPVGRGLGSSGAAVAAGLLLGAACAERDVAEEQLLEWGLALEGHPDNATASLLGGCTLGVPIGGGRLRVVRQELHPDLGFAVAWPAQPLSTARARAALPPEVAFADAVENPRRLALLLEGLRSAEPELLALGGVDRLHVDRRLPLIPGAREGLDAARAAGAWLATLSGAGSGLIAIGARSQVDDIAERMRAALDAAQPGARARAVEAVLAAPAVQGRAKP